MYPKGLTTEREALSSMHCMEGDLIALPKLSPRNDICGGADWESEVREEGILPEIGAVVMQEFIRKVSN